MLLAGTATGDVWMWLIPNGDCKVMPGQGVPSTCGACLSDGKLQCRTNLLQQNTIVAVDQYLYLHSTVPLAIHSVQSVPQISATSRITWTYRNICQYGEYGIYLILFLREKITMWLCRRCSENMGPKGSVPCGVLEWSG